ncbi:MAG: hypothetical protein WA156_02705 [Methylocystis silviterrae]
MGLSTREYLLEETGQLRRVSRRVVEGLLQGRDAMPEFAEKSFRAVSVVVESEGGKPIRILDAQGHYWRFDAEGKVDRSMQAAAFDFMDIAFQKRDNSSKVVSLTPEIRRREIKAMHRWDVTKEVLDTIAADLWPGIHGPAPEVKSIVAKTPKKPPLTWEAKQLLPEIGVKLATIANELAQLSEPALKGLAFEARRTADYREDNPPLWRGLAEACDRQREILRRRRLGSGVWYAVLVVYHRVEKSLYRNVFEAHAKCEGKGAAITAARELLKLHADKFSDEYSVEVDVYTDLEWMPEEV